MKKLNAVFLCAALLFRLTASGQYHHPKGQYINSNGAKLWVETMGKGEPLFLLAGGPGNSHLYMHSFDALKKSFTLVFIDAYGRGKSDMAAQAADYSINRDVEDIESVRKALGYEKINLLGHSYGSIPSELYAIKYGSHLNHLIIVSGFFSGAMWQENDDNSNHVLAENCPEQWDALIKLRARGLQSSDPGHIQLYGQFPSGLLYSYNPLNTKKFPADKEYPNDFNTKLYYQLVGADGDFKVEGDIGSFDVTNQLRDLKIPVLILAGRYDRVAVPKFTILFKSYCPQSTFIMFEHSGHWPQLEEPEKTFSVITFFLKK